MSDKRRIANASRSPAEMVAQIEIWVANPISMLPMEWRPAVLGFWMRWGHLIRDHLLTLAARVNDYRSTGITLEEMRGIFSRLNALEGERPVGFAPELFSAMAGMASAAVKRHRSLADAERRRREATDLPPNAAEIIHGLAERFRAGDDPDEKKVDHAERRHDQNRDARQARTGSAKTAGDRTKGPDDATGGGDGKTRPGGSDGENPRTTPVDRRTDRNAPDRSRGDVRRPDGGTPTGRRSA